MIEERPSFIHVCPSLNPSGRPSADCQKRLTLIHTHCKMHISQVPNANKSRNTTGEESWPGYRRLMFPFCVYLGEANSVLGRDEAPNMVDWGIWTVIHIQFLAISRNYEIESPYVTSYLFIVIRKDNSLMVRKFCCEVEQTCPMFRRVTWLFNPTR